MSHQAILNNYIIVIAIDKHYLKIFDLWMKYFERLNYKSCLNVITFDEESEKHIKEKDISSIRINKRINHPRDIYVTRLKVIKKILETGKHIIHTDCDAFWLHPQLQVIIKPDFDLQISIGYGIPKRAVKEWGFSLCCGFFIFHSNISTLNFFDIWIQKSMEMNHDQNALNELFLTSTTAWNLNNTSYNNGYCKTFDIKIEAIDYNIISRKNKKGAPVFHPYLASKYSHSKLLNAIRQLIKMEDEKFLHTAYYKELFNFFGWSSVLYTAFVRLTKKIMRNKNA